MCTHWGWRALVVIAKSGSSFQFLWSSPKSLRPCLLTFHTQFLGEPWKSWNFIDPLVLIFIKSLLDNDIYHLYSKSECKLVSVLEKKYCFLSDTYFFLWNQQVCMSGVVRVKEFFSFYCTPWAVSSSLFLLSGLAHAENIINFTAVERATTYANFFHH